MWPIFQWEQFYCDINFNQKLWLCSFISIHTQTKEITNGKGKGAWKDVKQGGFLYNQSLIIFSLNWKAQRSERQRNKNINGLCWSTQKHQFTAVGLSNSEKWKERPGRILRERSLKVWDTWETTAEGRYDTRTVTWGDKSTQKECRLQKQNTKFNVRIKV